MHVKGPALCLRHDKQRMNGKLHYFIQVLKQTLHGRHYVSILWIHNWGLEKLSNLSKLIQLLMGWALIWFLTTTQILRSLEIIMWVMKNNRNILCTYFILIVSETF